MPAARWIRKENSAGIKARGFAVSLAAFEWPLKDFIGTNLCLGSFM